MAEHQDTKQPSGPLLRASVALIFLAIAAGAIAIASREYHRTRSAVGESEAATEKTILDDQRD